MPRITASVTTSWTIRDRLVKTVVTSWKVRDRVTKTVNTSWRLRFRLNKTVTTNWALDTNIKPQADVPDYGCTSWPTSQSPFTRLYVDHIVLGYTKVYWEMSPRFHDPQPWEFQLQVNESGLAADAWVNVNTSVTNTFYAVDPIRRLYGKQLLTHYRVRIITPLGTYYSQPIGVFGRLNKRDWLLAREITRKELLRLKQYTAVDGFLLIAKRSGTVCTCVDALTNEVTNSRCEICYGTGYVGGYYVPYACTFFDLTPDQRHEMTDTQTRGTVDDTQRVGRFIGYPVVRAKDVFVDRDSDQRYYVTQVKGMAAIRDVPIVVAPVLMLAPFTSVIYRLEVRR